MSQEVISKKELLELTGISYGQLYRWKRKNIIPESWFIKKSSFTGQETFFPKEKILERIEKILELKDTHSLNELSDFFSPNPTEIKVTKEDLIKQGMVNEEIIRLFQEHFPKVTIFDFQAILCMHMVETLRPLANMECLDVMNFIYKNEAFGELLGIRKNGTLMWLFIRNKTDLKLEANAEIVIEINMMEKINELKMKLSTI